MKRNYYTNTGHLVAQYRSNYSRSYSEGKGFLYCTQAFELYLTCLGRWSAVPKLQLGENCVFKAMVHMWRSHAQYVREISVEI